MFPVGDLPLKIQPESDDSRCILVKLTDSSAKAIEEYLKNKEIIFPTAPTSNDSRPFKKFQFALSSVKESNKDTSASFQCISYFNSKLRTLGAIEQKLTVQANDDVFQATKEKVNKEAEEEKKNATKEIKPSGALVNRNNPSSNSATSNVNRPKPMSMKPGMNTSNVGNLNTSNSGSNNDIVKPRAAVLDRPLKERVMHLLAIRPSSKSELITKLNKDSPLNDKESLDQCLHAVSTFNPKLGTFELSNETMLNEVKEDWPYYTTTDRLMVKKNVSRIRQGASSANSSSLPQGPTTTTTTTTTTPGAIVKKEPAGGTSTSAFVSLRNSASTSGLHRPAATSSTLHNSSLDLGNDSKSAAANKRTTSPIKSTPGGGGGDQFKPIVGGGSAKQSQQQQHTPVVGGQRPGEKAAAAASSRIFDSMNLSPSSDIDLSSENLSFVGGGSAANGKKASSEKENGGGEASGKKFKPSLSDRQKEVEQTELVECSKKYKKVNNRKQRDSYQAEIDQIYDEYLELHKFMDSVASCFHKYQLELGTIKDETSREYDEKRSKIVSEYVEKQNDPDYVRKRERYAQIYTKLNYLHDLCKQYDSSLTL